jgi:hypothetical protein
MILGQLVGRCDIKRVWAHDPWRLGNRLLRKMLTHTLAVLLNIGFGNPPLHLEQLPA